MTDHEPTFTDALDSDPADEATPGPHGDRLYTPAPDEPQLTVRAVVTGCLLGGVVAAMNIYFGLRTGWSIGGSLIAAILGFSVWAGLRSIFSTKPISVLETNITQTSGSAAGSMASAAGLLSSIPALGLLGTKLSYLELSLWALAIAYLGVFFAVPLRNQMVVVEKLRFPTGTATAETIVSMFAEGGSAIAQARTLLYWGVIAGIFTIAAFFIPQLGHPPMPDLEAARTALESGPSLMQYVAFGLAVSGAWGFSLLVSPLMTGAGLLIGPRVGSSLLAGAIVSWAILGPFAQKQGWAEGPIMSYANGPRGWILWPGVAIMVADALSNLALSWRTILNTFRRVETAETADLEDPSQLVPNAWWLGGLLAGSTSATVVAWWVFDIPPWMTIIAIALSSVLAMIAVRSTGETDINPIGGMGKVTQLVFGGLGQGAGQTASQLMTTNLMCAGITGAGASQAGDMMQDLKAGRMLGAAPRKQVLAQCVGIAAGILVAVPIYKLFEKAGEVDPTKAIGGTDVPAPAAQAWKAMAELLSEGFGSLPPMATWAILAGAIFGAIVPVLRKSVPALAPYLPSGIAFGIAFIVPAYYSVAMFIGSMVLVSWHKMKPAHAALFVIPVASGLIAGEGLMGVVSAVLTLLGFGPIT